MRANVGTAQILPGEIPVPHSEDVPQRRAEIHALEIGKGTRDIRNSRSGKEGGKMNNAQLINQDSGNFEYYTPIEIVEAAREVMGGIDLDPASSETANKLIKATVFYDEDGLCQPWFGNVWMNHPFSRANNPLWINHLVSWYESMSKRQACCITFAATSEKWFRPLLDYPQCFLNPRTNYYLPDGTIKKGVTKGSVVTYLGDNINTFARVFSPFGKVK